MAIRAWMDGDLRLALRLLQWAQPELSQTTNASLAPDSAHNNQGHQNWGLEAA
jgi:hypothetical protein|tara:strand:+ start:1463 stop:1621 length:159 start_codon:yes stop_codon:yes gene_type:complete